jgi:predicted regulator of Ras-like GTPase activity (Roadblock/LC7/MglB family)
MDQSNINKRFEEKQLSKSQFESISESLSYLAEKLQVRALILTNSSGQVCAKKVSDNWNVDTMMLTTLTASSFSATVEIARLIGEKAQFKMVLHEGENLNVYVSSVTPHYFLIVIFEKGVAIGMVRLFTKRTIEQLLPTLKKSEQSNMQMDHIFNKNFQSLLNDELDQTFQD